MLQGTSTTRIWAACLPAPHQATRFSRPYCRLRSPLLCSCHRPPTPQCTSSPPSWCTGRSCCRPARRPRCGGEQGSGPVCPCMLPAKANPETNGIFTHPLPAFPTPACYLQQDGAGHRALCALPLPLLHPGGEAGPGSQGAVGAVCHQPITAVLMHQSCLAPTPAGPAALRAQLAPSFARSGAARAAASTWRGAPRARCWAPPAGLRGWRCWWRSAAGAWSWRCTWRRGWVVGRFWG